MKSRAYVSFLLFMLSVNVCLATDFQHLATKTWQHASAQTYSHAVWSGDLDRDGLIEIVSAGYRYNPTTDRHEACLRIYRYIASADSWMGEGARKWACLSGSIYAMDVDVGDPDKDGEIEIVTAGYFYDGTVWKYQVKVWFKARGNRGPQIEKTKNGIYGEETVLYAVAIGDVDNDGENEIVVAGRCNLSGQQYCSAYYSILGYSETAGFARAS